MEGKVPRIREEDVVVTKSTAGITEADGLVTLSLRTTADEPVEVSLVDPVPATHTLSVGDRSSETVYTDGDIAIEQVVKPDGVTEFDYHIDGPIERDLPVPTIEKIAPVSTDENVSTRVEWISADGETTPLAVTSETNATSLLATPQLKIAPVTPGLHGVAIGAVLTRTNEDALFRTVLRARRRGFPVFVISLVGDEETVETLEQLGVVVVSSPSQGASQNELYRTLSRTARERGLAGIVLQTRDCPRIDYDRTAEAFDRADYEVMAVPESWDRPSGPPTVVVGVPAYNAATSIGDVVERAAPYADEVVVVDDGSGDATAARAREAGATVVVHERNRGYGGALKTLFREAAGREAAHLVVIDADGQHDPADIPSLVETQERDGTDIVIGSRYVGDRTTRIPLVRSVGLAVINHLTNASLGNLRPSGFIRDTQSGYRVYSRYATRSLANDRSIGDDMGASTDILYHAHRKRLSVSEVETTISYDVENASSQGSISHGVDLVRNILWTVEYGRPLLILGLPGALVTSVGTVASVLSFVRFSQTGALVPAHLIVSMLYVIGGLLLCITAVMMHVLNNHPTMKRITDDENS